MARGERYADLRLLSDTKPLALKWTDDETPYQQLNLWERRKIEKRRADKQRSIYKPYGRRNYGWDSLADRNASSIAKTARTATSLVYSLSGFATFSLSDEIPTLQAGWHL